jgi:hypothetical protein
MLKAIVDAFTFDRPRSERPGTGSMRCSVYAAHVYTQQQGTSPADIRGDETTDRYNWTARRGGTRLYHDLHFDD